MRALAVALTVCVVGCGMCGGKSGQIATLEKADGPVERQAAGESTWSGAPIGTKYFLGDAARTGDGGAELALSGNTQISMQKHTVLRFGGKNGQTRLQVELGEIDLSGTGNINLDVGDVKLNGGKVRITARGDGKSEIKLTLGTAEVQTLGGETINLKLDLGVELSEVEVKALIDAGVDAPVDAAIDAPIDAPAPTGTIVTVTGKKGEIQLPGETKFTPLPEGDSELPAGAIVKTGAATTAKLVANGMTLELGGGSRATYTDKSQLSMETGTAKISTTGEGAVALPGGSIGIKNNGNNPSEVGVGPASGGTKVTINRGNGKLTGTGGNNLDMVRGESATLAKNGKITPLEANPSFFDFRITAGEGNFTIHDPRPPTAVQFQFGGKCTDGIIELDRNGTFRTAKVSGGKDFANHFVKPGSWNYQLRCTTGGTEGKAVASGRITVIPDAGSRPLPKLAGTSPFEPNGMSWKLGYQSVIPDLDVKFPGTGKSFTLHLARGGNDKPFPSNGNRLKISGKELSEGSYTYWFDRDGVRQDKSSSLKIEFDNTLPQVYIELPVNGKPWAGDIDVKGAVIAGWSAAVNDVPIPLDGARRFIAKVQPPSGNALAIKLSHPQRGVHYYLRRGK